MDHAPVPVPSVGIAHCPFMLPLCAVMSSSQPVHLPAARPHLGGGAASAIAQPCAADTVGPRVAPGVDHPKVEGAGGEADRWDLHCHAKVSQGPQRSHRCPSSNAPACRLMWLCFPGSWPSKLRGTACRAEAAPLRRLPPHAPCAPCALVSPRVRRRDVMAAWHSETEAAVGTASPSEPPGVHL